MRCARPCDFELALADPAATDGIALGVRCGMHAGTVEHRDNDYFGSTVNRAARIMAAAHGGQILLSQAVVESIREQLPAGVTLRDLGRVRLRDLASPEHVYQAGCIPSCARTFRALRSLESTPNNLPQQVTSFVGRERGQAEVKKAPRAKRRLLTLLGMGGLGKTRLSLQVAADVLDEYPDGVWFVELAPVADARLVAAGGRVRARRHGGGGPPRRRGARQVRPRPRAPRDPRQLRAPRARLRRPREAAARGGHPAQAPRIEPRAPARAGRDDLPGARRWRCRTRARRSPPTPCCNSKPSGCSSIAPRLCSRGSR